MCRMCEEADFDWLRAAETSKKARDGQPSPKPEVTADKREPAPADARR